MIEFYPSKTEVLNVNKSKPLMVGISPLLIQYYKTMGNDILDYVSFQRILVLNLTEQAKLIKNLGF